MNLFKKVLCTFIAAGIFISNFFVGAERSLIVNAETYSEDKNYGDYLLHKKIDGNDDGIYDYAVISGCDKSASEIDIPNKIDGLPVNIIESKAFRDCKNLTKITIPDSVTSIGSDVFRSCSGLTDITIPDSVTSIGSSAFYGCSGLTSIIIPDGVTYIEDHTFSYCMGLTSITISDDVTSIKGYAFSYCVGLTSIAIPDSLTSIGENVFDHCASLENISVSENNNNYSSVDGVLFNKKKTELIQYPIGNSGLEYIIPDSVTSIRKNAFYECTALINITIPKSVKTIGDSAFCNTPWFEAKKAKNPLVIVNDIVIDGKECTGNVIIPDSIVSISDRAFECNEMLVSVTFPDTLQSIGCYAFGGCQNLISAPIPNGLTVLRRGLFSGCTKITEIDIPENVVEIQSSVFSGCTGITSVTIRNPHCNIEFQSDVFAKNSVIYGYEISTAKVYAEKFGREFISISEEPNIKLEYSYEIIPLLAPFNNYFYIKTDDPDPSYFRFADNDSKYNDGSSYIERAAKFADVRYVDTETLRVNGGYIFYGGYTDGGDVSLEIYLNENVWFDTGVTYTLPQLYDTSDYLIYAYATKSNFFDNMDAVQSGFSSICFYSDSYIRGKVYKPRTFYGISNSPHIDQSFYIQSPYSRTDNESLFASSVYPFIYDSAGFPGIMGTVAKRLDSSAYYTKSSSNHYTIDVTCGGETRPYGGAGNGEGQGITKDKITRYFTFDESKENIAIGDIRKLLDEYANIEMPDDVPNDDRLTWSDVADTVGDGSWISVVRQNGGSPYGYSYLYKADDNNIYNESKMGVGGSNYWSGSLKYASDTWVDGRYVDFYEQFIPGEKFEDHNKSDIILFNITIPVLKYKRENQYISNTGEYEYSYTDIKISESVRNVRYVYDANENVWNADRDTIKITQSSLSDISNMVEQELIPEKYLNALQLTYEEVKALAVDSNTNVSPQQFYIYNRNAEPGTEVLPSDVNTQNPVTTAAVIADITVPAGVTATNYGDINLDGKINISDIVALNLYLLNQKAYPIEAQAIANADCVKDNIIDVSDSTILMNYIAEIADVSELGLH